MKAMIIRKGGPPEALQMGEIEAPPLQPGQARVRLRAAGLNHRDVWQRLAYPGPEPMVLGSDGAGTVEEVSDPGHRDWEGQAVVINSGLYWGPREDAPGPDFQILGNPTLGTYAETVAVPVENLAPKPEHLDFVQAAAFPLAGLTAWRALFTQGRLRPGETVLLPGIGSGVAGLAMVLARRAGCRVIVTSGSDAKLETARGEGAHFGVNYTDEHWEQRVREYAGPAGIDLVLDHSGEKTLPAAVRLVRPGGRVVFFGATTGPHLHIGLREAYFKQVHLIGTTMGSPREFEALCHFVALHRYTPQVHHIYPLAEAPAAQRLMEAGEQYGKIVLRIAGD